jgi:carbonyl reductase 1
MLLPASPRRQRLGLLLASVCSVFISNTVVAVVQAAAAMAVTSKTKRVALVTGANKGIGKEIVRLLSAQSSTTNNNNDGDVEWTILLGSRNVNQGQAAVEDLLRSRKGKSDSGSSINHRIICTRLDLTDPSSIQSTKELLEQEDVGNGILDVLINNAAICFNDPTLYGKVPYTPFQQQADITVRTNFFGTLDVTQAMLPLLQRSTHSGRIINIASAAGRLSILNKSPKLMQTFTSPDLTVDQLKDAMEDFIRTVQDGSHASKGYPNTCYGMSKCGIIAWTRILAREHSAKLAFYSVDPGYCATDQNNNQGMLPAARGAVTPVWLATMPIAVAAASPSAAASSSSSGCNNNKSGRHFYQEQEIAW